MQSWCCATLLPPLHAVPGLMMSTVICYQTTHANGVIKDLIKSPFTECWALRRAVDQALGTLWLGGVSLQKTYDGKCTCLLTT